MSSFYGRSGAGDGGGNRRMVVTELPTENIDPNAIYLVENDSDDADNAYTEYMYVNDEWEALGPYTPSLWIRGTGADSVVLAESASQTGARAVHA